MSELTERPILFSPEMILALLAGIKTQTRRIVKPVRRFEHHNILKVGMPHAYYPWTVWWHSPETDRVGCLQECPHGKPGDRLWVREALRVIDWDDTADSGCINPMGACIQYVADSQTRGWTHDEDPKWNVSMRWGRGKVGKTIPSIHMPRWASRIALQLTDVRVERLEDISEEDARAEGVTQLATEPGRHPHSGFCFHCGQGYGSHVGTARACFGGMGTIWNPGTYRGGYAFLWNQLNGKAHPWGSGTHVWVETVRRVS